MPYITTEDEEITLLKADYSVSRFWACGWTNSCPLKRWDYCLLVIPRNADAALQWYRTYYREELQRAEWELRSRKEKNSSNNSSINSASSDRSSFASSLNDSEQSELTQKQEWNLKLERFIAELKLIQNKDLVFKQKIFTDMKEGIRITAWTSIRKAGTEEESTTPWQLASYCNL